MASRTYEGVTQAGELSLRLLSSPTLLTVLDSLPSPGEDRLGMQVLVPASVPGRVADIDRAVADLRYLGLAKDDGTGLRRTTAGEDFLSVRKLLVEWGLAGEAPEDDASDHPAAPTLADLVNRMWTAEVLIQLAIHPMGTGELTAALQGPGLSTVKRYLRQARHAGLLVKDRTWTGSLGYRLTRRACLLVRPLSAALRLESRHLSEVSVPPSREIFRAGLAVAAQLLTVSPGRERHVLFQVVDDAGELLASELATYRRGTLFKISTSFHLPNLPTVVGTPSAWYELFIDRDPSRMLAHNPGAKAVVNQLRRDLCP